MAFPVVAALPAFLAALWSGLVVCFRWLVDHFHVVKIVGVCALIAGAFKVGILAYRTLVDNVSMWINELVNNVPNNNVSVVFSYLAKANYVLPLSEMFGLLSVYASFAAACLVIKGLIASYKAIPFKSA